MRSEKFGSAVSLLLLLCFASAGCERAFNFEVTNKTRSTIEVFSDEFSVGKVAPGKRASFRRGANDTTLSIGIKSQGGQVAEHRISEDEKIAAVSNSMTYDFTWDGKALAGPDKS